MDPNIVGSLIEATVTIVTGAAATFIAVWQFRRTQDKARKADDERQDELLKNSFSDLLEERRQIASAALDDPKTAEWLLDKFGLGDVDDSEYKMYISTMMMIDHYQHVHYRYTTGYFPAELWPSWQRSMEGAFKDEMVKRVWSGPFHRTLTKEFNDFVRAGCPEKTASDPILAENAEPNNRWFGIGYERTGRSITVRFTLY